MRATVSCQNTAIHWPRLDAVVVMIADPLRITLGRHILQAGETAENAPVTNMACFSGEVKTLTGREEVWLERGTQNIPGLAKSFISPFGQIFPHFPAKAPKKNLHNFRGPKKRHASHIVTWSKNKTGFFSMFGAFQSTSAVHTN